MPPVQLFQQVVHLLSDLLGWHVSPPTGAVIWTCPVYSSSRLGSRRMLSGSLILHTVHSGTSQDFIAQGRVAPPFISDRLRLPRLLRYVTRRRARSLRSTGAALHRASLPCASHALCLSCP